ncbi:OTU-domain-containing protein [Polychaeton citri CBS 116435]|uniref:OTU-domain-containing protein n=1 Tax=Polychaeton citri CBS 116435 TaxID=1314669 RepID=A0A9P4QIB3_9PEZI|nr:OTU-domain-containing protein [Polychaeton citri CBS 116435]
MEELQARHRKEARDLQSRITQKKKQASKKTRKGVNDECERLEQEMKERQAGETAALDSGAAADGEGDLAGKPEDPGLQADDGEDNDDAPPAATNGQSPSQTSVQDDDVAATGNGTSAPTQGGHTTPGRKPNRAKARLARRAAEQEAMVAEAALEAANLPDQKSQERERMLSYMDAHELAEKEIRADGHCLYSAVADQLGQLEIPVGCTLGGKPVFGYRAVRAAAAKYIEEHGEDFAPFLEEPLETYVGKVRDTGEWGGQLELLALARTYGVGINVLQDFGRVETIEGGAVEGKEGGEEREIWLGYYKHGFGLGEHYNSLRKVK